MREIKFRIFDKKQNKLLEIAVLYLQEKLFKLFSGSQYDVLDYDNEYFSKPMQYTGLKDKNGVEIYEGDIVSINEPIEIYAVEFQDGAFVPTSEKLQKCDNSYNLEFYLVIGNIYENKELLDA